MGDRHGMGQTAEEGVALRFIPKQEFASGDRPDRTIRLRMNDGSEQKQRSDELESDEDLRKEILALYDDFQPGLLCYLRSLHLGIDQAEQLIEEAFVRLSTELYERKEIRNVQGWIVRVTHNLAVNTIKRQKRETIIISHIATTVIKKSTDNALSPEEACWRKQQIGQIKVALSTLRPQQHQCLYMRIAGFRYKDIALALGISEQRAEFVVKQATSRLPMQSGLGQHPVLNVNGLGLKREAVPE